jgi:hypothetical protein
MTFEENQQQQIDQARFAQHINGENDAEWGNPPQSKDADYLDGYINAIKKLSTDANGILQFKTPQTQFAFGWVDGVDDEF